jgi:hypothetical protein
MSARRERRLLPSDSPRVGANGHSVLFIHQRLSLGDGGKPAVAADDAAAPRLVLFAALFLLILVAAGVGGWRRIELDARTDGVGMSR